MKKLSIILLSVCLIFTSLSFSACSSGQQNKESETSTNEKVLQTKEQAKELVFAISNIDLNFDPALTDAIEPCKIIYNIYDRLLGFNSETGALEPALAESYNIENGGKEFVFKLRKDVKFHDGTHCNADAVVFTLKRHMPPYEEGKEPIMSYVFDSVKSIDKIDEYTIKITLDEVNSTFLSNLATTYLSIVSPEAYKKYGDKYYENPVGTGPYKLAKYEKDKEIILERNEDYWGEKPKTEKITVKIANDDSEIIAGLLDGSIDASSTIDATDLNKLEQNKINIFKTNGIDANILRFNLEDPEISNIKIREAIVRAINKNELIESLYSGFADVATTYCPPAMVAYDKNISSYEYDPEKSKALLKEVNKEGMKLRFLAYDDVKQYNSVGGKLGEAIKSYLLKVGFDVELVVKPWKEFQKERRKGNYHIWLTGLISDICEPDEFLGEFKTGISINESKYSNPEVDKLLDKGITLFNDAEKVACYKEIEKIIARDVPILPLSYSVVLGASRPEVKGFKLNKLGFPVLTGLVKEK